jgi:4-nitrophenyl phosphatase
MQTGVDADPTIGAVMCGFDSKINYTKLARANRYLRENKGCIFMLTNDDRTFPTASGLQHPGKSRTTLLALVSRVVFPGGACGCV